MGAFNVLFVDSQAVFANYDNNMFNGSLVLEAFKIGRPDGKRQSGRWIDCKPAALGKMASSSQSCWHAQNRQV